MAKQAEKLCELGATDMEIADFFEVDPRTVYRWKHEHDEFCQALKVGKDVCDDRVERSLYQRATGYEFVEQQAFRVKKQFGPGEFEETVEVADVQKHQPTDTTAAIFWLKNRRKDDWKDKREIAGDPESPLMPKTDDERELARLTLFLLTKLERERE